MTCLAVIYRFSDDEERTSIPSHSPWPKKFSLELDLIGEVKVDATGLTLPEIAAAAWIETLGRYRHAKLIQLDAPQKFIDAQIDIGWITKETIQRAPSAWGAGDPVFICDNMVETWLILLCTSESSEVLGHKPSSTTGE